MLNTHHVETDDRQVLSLGLKREEVILKPQNSSVISVWELATYLFLLGVWSCHKCSSGSSLLLVILVVLGQGNALMAGGNLCLQLTQMLLDSFSSFLPLQCPF